MAKKKILIVDPPSGWMYGFPAPYENDYKRQLIKAGYPVKDLEFAMKNSWFWETEVDEDGTEGNP